MNEPVTLRIKPQPNVDGMQFTGDNTDAFMAWMYENEPTLISYTAHHDYPVVGYHRLTLTDYVTPKPIPYLVVCSSDREFRIYKGMWVLRSKAGLLSLHYEAEIRSKYDVVKKS